MNSTNLWMAVYRYYQLAYYVGVHCIKIEFRIFLCLSCVSNYGNTNLFVFFRINEVKLCKPNNEKRMLLDVVIMGLHAACYTQNDIAGVVGEQ